MNPHKDFYLTSNIRNTIFPILWFEEAFDVKSVPQYARELIELSNAKENSEIIKLKRPTLTKTAKNVHEITKNNSFHINFKNYKHLVPSLLLTVFYGLFYFFFIIFYVKYRY